MLVVSVASVVETMHDVGRTSGLGLEQLPREVCGELEHRPAECGSTFR